MFKKLTFDKATVQNWIAERGAALPQQEKMDSWLNKARQTGEALATTVAGALRQAETKLQQFAQEQPEVSSTQMRRQQLAEVGGEPEKNNFQKAQRDAGQNLALPLAGLGLTVAGSFLYAPLALLSIPLYLAPTMPIHKDTMQALKEKKATTDTLVTLTIAGSTLYGYYFVASLSGVLAILSRRLLLHIRDDSKKNIIDVFRQHPTTVWVLRDGLEVEQPFETLQAGDIVVAHAGERIAADGIVTAGAASVDQHILTGEARPVEKGIGDTVFASTVVLSGRVCIAVEKAGEATVVAQIGQILNRTTDFKSNSQLRAETLANKTVTPTLALSALSLPLVGPIGSLAVINAHFKSKLGVIVPISALNFLNQASQQHILIKDGRTLDLLNRVDTLVFDKTGTLTEEQPCIGLIFTCSEYDENELLAFAAAAEFKQTHPVAKAILQAAATRQLAVPVIDDAEYKIGYGLTVRMDDQLIRVGSSRFMEMEAIALPPLIQQVQESCQQEGYSLVMVAVEDRLVGAIQLIPSVRAEAKAVIQRLRQQANIKAIFIISGDQEAPTKALADELGVDFYCAETLPEQKADLIEQLQAEGKFICYIGDGINDAIALKKAQVSISLRGASTVATDTAQIILMDQSLQQLPTIFEMARGFHANTNLCFAAALIPALIGTGGALFLQYGLLNTLILNQIGWLGGLTCAMTPAWRQRWFGAKTVVSESVGQ